MPIKLNKPQEKSLPISGSITPSAKDVEGGKTILITAAYTDKGKKPLTGVESVYVEAVKK
jgi:hypothetical protein